jgi:hypothetical protein
MFLLFLLLLLLRQHRRRRRRWGVSIVSVLLLLLRVGDSMVDAFTGRSMLLLLLQLVRLWHSGDVFSTWLGISAVIVIGNSSHALTRILLLLLLLQCRVARRNQRGISTYGVANMFISVV